MKVELYGYTDVGNRAENQDSGTASELGDGRFFIVVADGLGGHKGGQEASRIAVRHLAVDSPNGLPTAEELTARLTEANNEILAKRRDANQMKSTVVAVFVNGRQAVWAHIGDSRLYHFHDGVLTHYTNDHSVPQISVQLGEITRDQIPSHPDRSRLIRVLGTEELRPEITGPVELAPGQHAFLLCSDGFWEYLHEDEIMLDLNKSPTVKDWVDGLRWRRSKRLGQDVDNNTAIAAYYEV